MPKARPIMVGGTASDPPGSNTSGCWIKRSQLRLRIKSTTSRIFTNVPSPPTIPDLMVRPLNELVATKI